MGQWFSSRWPKMIGIAGFILVTATIFHGVLALDNGHSPQDDDAYGLAFAMLISAWWAYFFVVAFTTWILSLWLRTRSVWMLALAPIVAVVACKTFKPLPTETTALVLAFLFFTAIAALPILLGASTNISGRFRNFRHIKSAVN